MGNRATLLLLVLAAALGALLLAMPHLNLVDRGPIAIQPGVPETSEGGTSTEFVPGAAVDLSEFTETVDRPLFAEDRRPPSEEAPAPIVEQPVAVQAVAPPPLELSAVVIDGERRLALFRATGAGASSRRVEEGNEVEGWTLSAVRPDGVVLERNGETHEMVLRTFKAPPQPARARAPAQAPNARQADRDAAPAAVPRARPRRPLRGPRQRSLRRRNSS